MESLDYGIEGPDGLTIFPGGEKGNNGYRWVWSREKFTKALALGMIEFTKSQKEVGKYKVYYKIYEKVDTEGNYSEKRLPFGTFFLDGYTNRQAVFEVKKLFEGKRIFDYPKPTSFVKEILKIGARKDGIILDFFAGSATTADAVMQLNAEDGGKRRYILCTLDEAVADKSAAKEAGYETIDQISRERIRRAAAKIRADKPEQTQDQDLGFKAFRLDSSNFRDIKQTPDQLTQDSLFDSVSNIKSGRTDLDLLYQIMLAWGIELSEPVVKTEMSGTTVYNVADGALLASFDDQISEETLRQMARLEPFRVVFKDESFATSAAKINLSQIFKEDAPNTKVKVV